MVRRPSLGETHVIGEAIQKELLTRSCDFTDDGRIHTRTCNRRRAGHIGSAFSSLIARRWSCANAAYHDQASRPAVPHPLRFVGRPLRSRQPRSAECGTVAGGNVCRIRAQHKRRCRETAPDSRRFGRKSAFYRNSSTPGIPVFGAGRGDRAPGSTDPGPCGRRG